MLAMADTSDDAISHPLGRLRVRHLAIMAEADRYAASNPAAEEPKPPKARRFESLTDDEWQACAAFWPSAAHGLYEPRLLLDAALEVTTFGTAWHLVYGGYGARQFFIRRSRSRHVERLVAVALASPVISDERRLQFEALRRAADVFVQRRGLAPVRTARQQRA